MAETKAARLFSAEEANRALPLIRRIVIDIQEAFARVKIAVDEANRCSSDSEKQDRAENAKMDALALIEELVKIGVDLKDPEEGLVDFPSMRENQPVCLCWKLGEEKVSWWHPPQAGFRGRRAL
jgi:hypothetical protein